MHMVYGVDQEIHQALPAIPPLDSRLGLRLHDRQRGRRWALEVFARVVDNQDRIGILRVGSSQTTLRAVEEPTPGFTTCNLRGYLNVTRNLHLASGIDNVFDRTYIEHLSLRLPFEPNAPQIPPTRVLSPGFTPYFTMEWVY
jgi:iron complex outermembrane receptor protein